MTVTLPGGPSGPPFSLALWLCVMASSAALFRHWLSSGSVAAWLTRCSFPHLRDFTRSQRGCCQKPQEPPAPHWRHGTGCK